jgi:hypothetical protein
MDLLFTDHEGGEVMCLGVMYFSLHVSEPL